MISAKTKFFVLNCPFIFTGLNEVVANVIVLHLSVILFTGWGCLPQCMLGYHTPGADTPPEADTPLEQTPPQSRHPPGADTPPEQRPPGADTPWSRHPPGSRHTPLGEDNPLGTDPPRSRHPSGADTPQSRHPPTGADTLPPCWSRHPLVADTPPLGSRLWHTVNERPVRILLECILVKLVARQRVTSMDLRVFMQLEITQEPPVTFCHSVNSI